MYVFDRVKQLSDGVQKVSWLRESFPFVLTFQVDNRIMQVKMEVMEEVQAKMVPENILSNVSSLLWIKANVLVPHEIDGHS